MSLYLNNARVMDHHLTSFSFRWLNNEGIYQMLMVCGWAMMGKEIKGYIGTEQNDLNGG